MNLLRLVDLIILLADQFKSLMLRSKKSEIIKAKDEALETGDQRGFEKAIANSTEDIITDLPAGKYSGMFERATKKKP